ncbi:MAG: PLP-dependent transferase, partial [Caldilineales bacterium]|nr:PLP-dependent transferase [Caldilineales bacterium]
YARDGSPTPALLEEALTTLARGRYTTVFGSGMAAIAAALAVAAAGKRVLAAPDLYGRTYHLMQSWLPGTGAEVRFANAQDHEGIAALLRDWQPHLLVLETLSNPLVKISDLPWLIAQAQAVGCKTLVDNTFASPYLCRPAELGAAFTVESLTKYINGHGDVTGGAVTCLEAGDHKALVEYRTAFGAVLDPQAAWLTLRGLRTLGLRLRQQCANAAALAAFLTVHPAVAHVYYPGLSHHPGHALAGQMFGGRGFGGMLAFDLAEATRARAWQVMDRLHVAVAAPTLGDIATLVSHPRTASHRNLTPAQAAAIGIGEGAIRVSAGIEHSDDLLADFRQALA